MTIKLLCGWILIYGVVCGASLFLIFEKTRLSSASKTHKIVAGIIIGTVFFAMIIAGSYLLSVIPWDYKVW